MNMKNFILVISLFLLETSTAWSKTPIISFFNEMNSHDLSVMFEDSSIIESIKKMHAEVRMGLVDLTYDRVQVV